MAQQAFPTCSDQITLSNFDTQQLVLYVPWIRPKHLSQGCGTGTQISSSGFGNLIFLAPTPTSWDFWLWLQNNLVQKTEKTLYYLYNSFEPESKFQAPAPAIQNCLGSGSTALVEASISFLSMRVGLPFFLFTCCKELV